MSRRVRPALLALLMGCAPSRGGMPCTSVADCDDLEGRDYRYYCSPDDSFTCQPSCNPCEEHMYCCPDGSPCDLGLGCSAAFEPMDTCDGSGAGCASGWVCRLTTVGVRRCMEADCRPEDGLCEAPQDWRACLPDPEAAGRFVCWIGGTIRIGQSCDTSYDCVGAAGCGRDGVCALACSDDADCAVLEDATACVNFVCVLPETPDAGG